MERIRHQPAAAAIAAGLVAVGITTLIRRWRTPLPPGRPLEVIAKLPAVNTKAADVSVVLIHGMWHGSWYFEGLQTLLAARGIASYAVALQGDAPDMNRHEAAVVADLRVTMDSLGLRNVVLLGHSQGSLVAQAFLRDALSSRPQGEIGGMVLLGGVPLGMIPPLSLLQGRRHDGGSATMYWDRAYAYFLLTGRIQRKHWARRIFALTKGQTETLPETTGHLSATNSSMDEYLTKLVAAPADGCITMNHFNPPSMHRIEDVPILVLGAAEDVIYPPAKVEDGFRERYPNAMHVVAEGQAHCFLDPGWETTVGGPLIRWLVERTKE